MVLAQSPSEDFKSRRLQELQSLRGSARGEDPLTGLHVPFHRAGSTHLHVASHSPGPPWQGSLGEPGLVYMVAGLGKRGDEGGERGGGEEGEKETVRERKEEGGRTSKSTQPR